MRTFFLHLDAAGDRSAHRTEPGVDTAYAPKAQKATSFTGNQGEAQ
jgi:hypothetical protein